MFLLAGCFWLLNFQVRKVYLLNPAHFLLFSAHEKHAISKKTEYENLSLVLSLQKAQEMGASISLGHFEKLNIRAPEAITVEAELDEKGRLILLPRRWAKRRAMSVFSRFLGN